MIRRSYPQIDHIVGINLGKSGAWELIHTPRQLNFHEICVMCHTAPNEKRENRITGPLQNGNNGGHNGGPIRNRPGIPRSASSPWRTRWPGTALSNDIKAARPALPSSGASRQARYLETPKFLSRRSFGLFHLNQMPLLNAHDTIHARRQPWIMGGDQGGQTGAPRKFQQQIEHLIRRIRI